MPKPFSCWGTSGKEQGRVMAGRSGATSTDEVIREGNGQAGWGGVRTSPKGLFCSAGDPRAGGWGTQPTPSSGTTCPSRDPEPGAGAEGTSLGFVPRAQSQFGGTGPSLFLAQQVAWGGGREALLLPPKRRDPHGKKNLGQVGPQGRLWPGQWLGELDCTSLAPGMGLG